MLLPQQKSVFFTPLPLNCKFTVEEGNKRPPEEVYFSDKRHTF
jgi:hypothetical protein